jgi:predicted DNA-binding protein (MmcQ/YjbR family)
MDVADLMDLCLSLPHAIDETPFGPDTVVVKIGGKIFAIIPLDTVQPQVSVKADPEHVIEMREAYSEATPAPHMSKKHWIRMYTDGMIPRDVIVQRVRTSYQLVRDSLPRSVAREFEAQ